jgi:hypothetical protein
MAQRESTPAGNGLFATPEPPELGPGPRTTVDSIAVVTQRAEELCARHNVRAATRPLVRALALLWHDHLEAAHQIVQDLAGADASYIHAIMHRREPDFGNAKYWFHRVGSHPAYPTLAERARDHLTSPAGARLRTRICPEGNWDAFSFVDACAEARSMDDLRAVQALEFTVLLERLLA